MYAPKDLFAIGKEVTEYVAIAGLVWRAFIFLHRATETVTAIPQFMTDTTQGLKNIQTHAETAVNNHLTHMEEGITQLAESTGQMANHMGVMQDMFQKHILDISNKQAIILDRLP